MMPEDVLELLHWLEMIEGREREIIALQGQIYALLSVILGAFLSYVIVEFLSRFFPRR